jgi:hypothetical protein
MKSLPAAPNDLEPSAPLSVSLPLKVAWPRPRALKNEILDRGDIALRQCFLDVTFSRVDLT